MDDNGNISDKLEEIEQKLNSTLNQMRASDYASEMKNKKMMEQWLGVLYKEFKNELKKTKQEIIKEIKNGRRN